MRPIFYDTETTGLTADKDRIIEIAAFDPVLNKTFSTLINPEMPIPEESFSISHIQDDMVKDAPLFSQAGKDFFAFCQGEVILVAHNNDGFDLAFLQKECQRSGIEIPPSLKFFDTLKWARKYRKDLPRHGLQYLREIYEIPPNEAHRALNDVMILYEVFTRMVDDIPIEKAHELLYKAFPSQPKFTENVMPFGKHKGKPLQELPKGYIQWLAENEILNKEENRSLATQLQSLGLLPKRSMV